MVTAGRSNGLALLAVAVEEEAFTASEGGSALKTVPFGSSGARSTGVAGTLVEARVASAGNTVEEGVGGADRVGDDGRDILASTVVENESGLADAARTRVVSVGRAGGDLNALTVQELSALDADTSLKSSIITLVFVTVGSEAALDALTVDVANVADQALADNTIIGFVGITRLAAAQNPEVSRVALAVTVSKGGVNAAVLV